MTNKTKPQSPRSSLRVFVSACLAISAVSVLVHAQAASKTRIAVETLASPRLEGRLAGSSGERLASDFLVAELQKIGAKPLPGQRDFRLPFEFTAGMKDGGSKVTLKVGGGPEPGGDVPTVGGLNAMFAARALSFSDNG